MAEEAKTKAKTVNVKTSEKVLDGASFFHPEQKVHIGREPVKVEKDALVNQWLATEQLVEV
jgi:hypothetical protein